MRGGRPPATLVFALVVASSLVLSACATEPVADWAPPGWAEEGATSVATAESTAGALEQVQPALLGQRIRNDAMHLQARWVYLPGEHAFNDRIDDFVWNAIRQSDGTYAPQAAEAGLAERGCVPGSLALPAAEILADPELGPAGGSGLSVTCEVAGAFGPVIGVSMRVVAGDADEIDRDERTTIYANLETGDLVESERLWNDRAAPELWTQTVEGMRRDAGALSQTPVAAPSAEQLELATTALDSAQLRHGGGAIVTLPPGLTSPELVGLGIPATDEPSQVEIEAETVARWSDLGEQLVAGAMDAPFVGLPAWSADSHVDCALVPCVAITYDDGPSEFTGQLLDTLRAARAPATFFMLGRNIGLYPDMVGTVAAEGHEIGSHTMNHPDLTDLDKTEMRDEVYDAAELIEEHTGTLVTSYRPPYGEIDKKVKKEIKLPAVLWSVDTNDWQHPGAELLVERAVDGASPGSIVLFHDIHEDTVAAAGAVLEGYADRGFVPVTVTQLFDGSLPAGEVKAR